MRFFSSFKNSIVWIYIVILFVPIIIMGMIFLYSLQNASAKAEKDLATTLQQVQNYIDSELTSADQIYKQILAIQNVESLNGIGSDLNARQRYNVYKLIPNLRAFTLSSSRIEGVYLYFPNSDFIVSGSGSFDRATINHWFDCANGLNKDKILGMLKGNGAASFQPVEYIDPQSNPDSRKVQPMIAYIRSLAFSSTQAPPVVMLVLMKQSEILQAYDKLYQSSYCNVSIIGSDGSALFNELPGYLQGVRPDVLVGGDKGKHVEIQDGNVKYVLKASKSPVTGWHYALSMPENMFAANIIETKYSMLIYFLFYTIIIIVSSWYFYKKNYKPLHKLIDMLKNLAKPAKGANEISYIEKSVEYLLEDNKKFVSLLKNQKNNLLHGALSRMITSPQDITNADEIGLCFDRPHNFIFIIYAVLGGMDQAGHNGTLFTNKQMNAMDNAFKDIDHVYMLQSSDFVAFLVNTDVDMSFIAARARQVCTDLKQESHTKWDFNVAFSTKHDSLDEFAKAYSEAIEVKEYKTYLNKPNIIFYDEMVASFDLLSPYNWHIETELRIINHIKMKEYEQAIDIINKQMMNILASTEQSLSLVKCRMFGIINLLLSVISEMRSMYDFQFMKEVNAADILLGCKSIQELQVCMNDIFRQLSDYISQKEKDLDNSRMKAMMDFIKNNYSRQDMSITYLAQVFGRNESSISRSFKRYVGMGFLDYLHSLRIDEAKKLIKKGLHIKKVASMVGYTNDITLIRAFKRYEGATPSKFRDDEPADFKGNGYISENK